MIKSRTAKIGDLIIAFICFIVILICLLPMLNVLARSLSSANALMRNEVLVWPVGWNFTAYITVLNDSKYVWSLGWTAILTVISTVVSMLMTTICAYPLIFDELKGKTFFNTIIILTMYFSAGTIPNYLLMKELHLLNNPAVLVIPGCLSVFNMIIMRSFLQGILENTPKELSELTDGKFKETKKITVEVYDRANDGGSKPEDNYYTKYIKEGMLRDHNVEVTFKPVPRWTEVQQINNLLAAGTAPDVCVTYDYPTIQTYANMGGVMDLNPELSKYKKARPNLWGLLTDTNLYYDQDPEKKTLWAIEARLANSARINTFVRQDWLKKLNLSEPKTIDEFEAMLKAFKANADTLLGKDANKMVPFSISTDVGWRADHLLTSFVPSSITDKDTFVYGFDDRKLLFPSIKNGVKKLNDWYNQGLIWKDFPMYSQAGDKTEDNMIKAGYVGAFIHNWDYPYRDGDNSINNNIKRAAGPDAGFIAVAAFKNDAGKYTKFLPQPVDRKVFLPATNKEPLASLLYLDWISKAENRQFLQIGDEGVTHQKMSDGSVKTIAAKGEKIMNSPLNID